MSATSYPLAWPEGWTRTPAHQRQRARYKVTGARATDGLIHELKLMGAARSAIVLSTNIVLRNDGLPCANQPRHMQDDPGVARVLVDAQLQGPRHRLRQVARRLRQHPRAAAVDQRHAQHRPCGRFPSPRACVHSVRRSASQLRSGAGRAPLVGSVRAEAGAARSLRPASGGSAAAMTELNRARVDMQRHFADSRL